MKTYKRVSGLKKLAVLSMMGTTFAFPLGACNISDFTATTTTTTTLSGPEVIAALVRSTILTPIDNFITDRINAFFEQLADDED